MKNKTLLLGLNELNFDYIQYYINQGLLPNFKKLFDTQYPIQTESELEYKLLEPWIQWVTIHTGKTYNEHKVLRLGDIVDYPNLSQLFEEIEAHGKTVGAVSPFNADNRLRKPAFFIPDPWTETKVSGNWIQKILYKAIHQSVNDNAQNKIDIKSILSLLIGFLYSVPINRWSHYIKCLLNVKKPGLKAVILDSLLADLFLKSWKNSKPDFSNLFLNSGAHIQHHFLFNSEAYKGDLKNPSWYCKNEYDPLLVIFKEYDNVIERLSQINNLNIIIATGLHQEPHKNLTFYWRLKKHKSFVESIGIKNYKNISTRMSRDFLITFNNSSNAIEAEKILNSYYSYSDKIKIFNIDNRGDSLFVELVYPNEIKKSDSIYSKLTNKKLHSFKSYIAFVAIKNAEHNGVGYVTSNFNFDSKKTIKLKDLKDKIKKIALG